MEIYHYSPETGEYLGMGQARLCPLTKQHLLPAYATFVAPPISAAGYKAVFANGWQVQQDHRGKSGYVDGLPFEIVDLGPLPSGWSEEPPAPTVEEKALAEINRLEAEITQRRMRDAVLGTDGGWLAAKEAEIAAQREKLTHE